MRTRGQATAQLEWTIMQKLAGKLFRHGDGGGWTAGRRSEVGKLV